MMFKYDEKLAILELGKRTLGLLSDNFLTQVPVEELVSGMVSHLPLKEDLEEYELVFKAFLTLYSAGHAVTPQCIPKIVESAAHFTTAHNVDKTKVSAGRLFWSEQCRPLS